MQLMKECYVSYQVAINTQRNGIYTSVLNRNIRYLRVSGLLGYWKQMEMNKVARLVNGKAIFYSVTKN